MCHAAYTNSYVCIMYIYVRMYTETVYVNNVKRERVTNSSHQVVFVCVGKCRGFEGGGATLFSGSHSNPGQFDDISVAIVLRG